MEEQEAPQQTDMSGDGNQPEGTGWTAPNDPLDEVPPSEIPVGVDSIDAQAPPADDGGDGDDGGNAPLDLAELDSGDTDADAAGDAEPEADAASDAEPEAAADPPPEPDPELVAEAQKAAADPAPDVVAERAAADEAGEVGDADLGAHPDPMGDAEAAGAAAAADAEPASADE